MTTPVGAYELEILTGPTVEEGTSTEENGRRATLALESEQGDPLGSITFYGPEVTLPPDFVSRANRPLLHLHTDTLPSVLALLQSEKRVFVEFTDGGGRITSIGDSTV